MQKPGLLARPGPFFVVHVAFLFASIEYESDSRAMQAEAVLKIVKKKLKAHVRIDRQEGDHRNLFLAYFELKARLGKAAK